jgi:hypothetical protein
VLARSIFLTLIVVHPFIRNAAQRSEADNRSEDRGTLLSFAKTASASLGERPRCSDRPQEAEDS